MGNVIERCQHGNIVVVGNVVVDCVPCATLRRTPQMHRLRELVDGVIQAKLAAARLLAQLAVMLDQRLPPTWEELEFPREKYRQLLAAIDDKESEVDALIASIAGAPASSEGLVP